MTYHELFSRMIDALHARDLTAAEALLSKARATMPLDNPGIVGLNALKHMRDMLAIDAG